MIATTTLNSSHETARLPRESRRHAAGAALTALVVEDHDDTRQMLRVLLETRGIRVVEAADGEAGVSAAARECPALVLMDGNMPVLDGITAARRIREADCLRDVAIVIVSGRAEPDYRARALAAGCDGFLVKPFSVEQLDAVIDRHLPAACDGRKAAAVLK